MHGLYILETDAIPSTIFCGSLSVDGDLWQQRLGHPSFAKLQHMSGILPMSRSHFSHCEICLLAKQKRLPFLSHNHLSISPFDLIHLDIWGPFSVKSIEGSKYFFTIIDDCTRVTWLYMLRNKSDVATIFLLL